jgi:hypothetical protein
MSVSPEIDFEAWFQDGKNEQSFNLNLLWQSFTTLPTEVEALQQDAGGVPRLFHMHFSMRFSYALFQFALFAIMIF